MSTEQPERMTDEQIEAVIEYAKEEECFCADGVDAKCMPCQTKIALIQLRTDLAAANERAEKAGFAHGFTSGTLDVALKKLTLAEKQRDAAVEGLKKISENREDYNEAGLEIEAGDTLTRIREMGEKGGE
jgi:uncharacterized protein YihD (DUF1040 family)